MLDELDIKAQEIRGLLEVGRTIFSAEVERARIAEIKAKTAAADPALQSFLERVTAQAKK